ncbi:hypothetical protein [Pseudovibrio sp. Tun.PSC04-5.I4]|uniref:hypothetical protein n=1 Tax=Pseudovibrio sp. Tun.PSC04-5.I4 TaxID=1798213 RepID=UPI000880FDD7|nr:hypothetical protein [Pseudovibrio sp. Tun.PSC04-5.I4]SDQ31374.1 hypothetical protein SAMN04515695_0784 [Pseudovibrio sp. Tun.PSC04-5.I4]
MKKNCSTTTSNAQFLLMGDSHAGAIGRAAKETGIDLVGGPMGAGREFTAPFFDLDNGDLSFHSDYAEEMYRSFLKELGVASLQEVKIPVVATFGFALHFYATKENWDIYKGPNLTLSPAFLESTLFAELIRSMARGAFDFYEALLGMGIEVFAVLAPQKVPDTSEALVFKAAQRALVAKAAELRLPLLDVRATTTDRNGWQSPAFSQENDPIHGNSAFGNAVLQALKRQRVSPHAYS